MIKYGIFFKLRLYFDELVIREKVFLESSHHFVTHLDVVVEVLKFQISVAFDFFLDEEFIGVW